MSGGGELYRIDLDPRRPGSSLPGDVNPRGSIGGSDVGANPRDDQRVRDLIEEYAEETNILNQLNLLRHSGGGLKMLKSVYYPNWVVLFSGVVGTLNAESDNYTVVLPESNNTILITLSGQMIVDLPSNADPAAISRQQWFVKLDGTQITNSQDALWEFPNLPLSTAKFVTVPLYWSWALKRGQQSGGLTAATSATVLTPGPHNWTVRWGMSSMGHSGTTIDIQVKQLHVTWYELHDVEDPLVQFNTDAVI